MTDSLVIALAQLNPGMGELEGNLRKVLEARDKAAQGGADLVVYPELVVCGYPPEDLVLKPFFQDRVAAMVQRLVAASADGGPAMLVGAPWRQDGGLYNAALMLDGGRLSARYKVDLPNYGVFDEQRVFSPGQPPGPIDFRGVRLGVMLCEDMWTPEVSECLQESGAEILVVPNGSPFDTGKFERRIQLAVARITESGLPLIYVNQVGGQDELVFDGGSFVLGRDCALKAQLPQFDEAVGLTRWRRHGGDGWRCDAAEVVKPYEGLEAIYRALTLGLHDYVEKNGFPGVVLGLSGGVDSALSATVAVDALGPERVHCVMMPSPYTSRESLADAAECAALLGARLDTVEIEDAMRTMDAMLKPLFDGRPADTTEENIQARLRGVTLMAISNKLGFMVLSTGNKSEMSVGYATLYGDMCGGFSVLKDVYKTTVYGLGRWRNQHVPGGASGPRGRAIPERILTKAPSAELKPDQTDQDSLPPYDRLDDILECLIEAELAVADIVARGHDKTLVQRVWRMLDRAEYKRRQAPPGVRITARAFGRDRRYPITNAFVDLA